mgnify:CR=1 FL=1
MENHDFGVIFVQQPLDKFETEPAEAVAVGNHNRLDSSLHTEFQKGTQTLTFEVEGKLCLPVSSANPRTDVDEFVDISLWKRCACSIVDFPLLIRSML